MENGQKTKTHTIWKYGRYQVKIPPTYLHDNLSALRILEQVFPADDNNSFPSGDFDPY
jgi:hypothetical protein